MMSSINVAAFWFCTLLGLSWSSLEFPPDFQFGAATSSYQIEGGWNADGKGPSIWDRLFHSAVNSGYVNQTGDVAADSYYQWPQDVKAAADMGLDFYRFSISWPRILPTGCTNRVNPAGVRYYNELIDALLAAGVQPVLTLYHFDLPTAIQDLGGWTNPIIVDVFGEYARLVFSLYADRVKTWITINEGIVICDLTYNIGQFAPQIREPAFAPFLCNKNVMLAHAKAYRIFDEEFRHKYGGKVSIANNLLWVEPVTPDDLELAELGRQHTIGRFSHPIFSKEGGWPPTTEKLMATVSRREGYAKSRLPPFSEQEKMFVQGTADFFSLNHYTTSMIRPARAGEAPGTWFINGSAELDAVLEHPPGSTYGALDIMPIYPQGIRRLLNWVRQQYGDVEVFVSENGLATSGPNIQDHLRVDYLNRYMEQVLLAMKDGVRVTGYTVWSLIDNFEWFDGYNTKFGLYVVDFDDPERARRPRLSAHHYACVIRHRTLDYPPSCVQERQNEP